MSAACATAAAAVSAPAPGFTRAGGRLRDRRYLAVTIGLTILVAALWWAQVLIGDTWYAPGEVLRVMAGQTVPGASFTVGELRLPRAVVGLLTGLAFGMAGTTSQTMLRNPLASPDVIGITAGTSAAAVFGILVMDWSGTVLSVVAVVAGVLTALVILALAGSGSSQGGRLILIGIGVSAMFSSVTAYLQMRASVYDVADAMRWLSGSLSSTRWSEVPVLAACVALCGVALAVVGRDLRVLPLGEETAVGLGVRANRSRLVLMVVVVVLCAFATAVTGPIAFVSFLAGPIAGRLVGRADRSPVLPAGLLGAALVLGADLVGQHLFPTALPVGVVTGVVGAPYLLLLLIRLNRQGASS